jgi:hypothetical protein
LRRTGVADSVVRLGRLAGMAHDKRVSFGHLAHHRVKVTRRLHLAAGVFALMSASSITAVIADLTNSMTVKIFSALLGFASGLITLIVSKIYDDAETRNLFQAAAKFLHIRESADLVRERPGVTEGQAFAALERLTREYNQCSAQYESSHVIIHKDGIGRSVVVGELAARLAAVGKSPNQILELSGDSDMPSGNERIST